MAVGALSATEGASVLAARSGSFRAIVDLAGVHTSADLFRNVWGGV